MIRIARLLTAGTALCAVLHVGLTSAAAVGDSSARAACDRLAKAQNVLGIDLVRFRAATNELARSRSAGARAVADQLEASYEEDARSPSVALRVAREWCDRTVTTTTRPAPTTAPYVDPQHYEGSGDSEITLPTDVGAALARIAVRDLERFTVESVGADGRPLETLVDTDHAYIGTRPLNFESGPAADRLRVASDGVWTIDVVDVDEAPRLVAPGHYDGTGDQILFVGGDPTHATFRSTATTGRFVVDGYGIFKAPLVDEATPYRGTVVLPREAKYVLEIRADGAWSADLR
jgi:hypothetical protein